MTTLSFKLNLLQAGQPAARPVDAAADAAVAAALEEYLAAAEAARVVVAEVVAVSPEDLAAVGLAVVDLVAAAAEAARLAVPARPRRRKWRPRQALGPRLNQKAQGLLTTRIWEMSKTEMSSPKAAARRRLPAQTPPSADARHK